MNSLFVNGNSGGSNMSENSLPLIFMCPGVYCKMVLMPQEASRVNWIEYFGCDVNDCGDAIFKGFYSSLGV